MNWDLRCKRRGLGAAPWEPIGAAVSGFETYTDSIGLSPSTAYEYRVVAYNADKEAVGATPAPATTLDGGTAPAAPNLVIDQQLHSRIRLSGWGELAPGQSVSIFAGPTPDFVANSSSLIASNVTDNFFEDTETEIGGTYSYQVSITDPNGVSSPPSTSQTAAATGASPSIDAEGAFVNEGAPRPYDLVAFYGAGEFKNEPENPEIWGNERIADLAKELGGTIRRDDADPTEVGKPFKWTEGRNALRDLLHRHDANGDFIIQAAETPTDVRVFGWSLGAIEAANFTRDLSARKDNVGGWRKPQHWNGNRIRFIWEPKGGYGIARAIPITRLALFDPVTSAVAGASRLLNNTKGPRANVQYFRSYYQTRNEHSAVRVTQDEAGVIFVADDIHKKSFAGSRIPEDGVAEPLLRQFNLNTAPEYANLPVTRTPYILKDKDAAFPGPYYGTLAGFDVNHSTSVFYAYDFVKHDIDGILA